MPRCKRANLKKVHLPVAPIDVCPISNFSWVNDVPHSEKSSNLTGGEAFGFNPKTRIFLNTAFAMGNQ